MDSLNIQEISNETIKALMHVPYIEKKLASSFNFTFRYIDDVLSLNNSKLGDFVDRIFPIELEIPVIQIRLFHTFNYTSKLTVRGG